MSKQDRQGVRKASDLERKYNLGQDYDTFATLATSAQKSAERAENAAGEATTSATKAEATVSGLTERVGALESSRFTGSYTGNGTFGIDAPNSISFDFTPNLIVITGSGGIGDYPWVYGAPKGRISADAYVELTWSDHSVSWYSTDADTQLNTSECVYYYTAV